MSDAKTSEILKSEENNNKSGKVSPHLPLHPILVKHLTLQDDDDDYFKGQFRPRANTDPMPPRRRGKVHVHFDLPDIIVDDCSDNDEDNLDSSRPEEINKELRNTSEGAFFVFTSPPRQRSNTCPNNLFSKRRSKLLDRPPTPPPCDKLPRDTFPKYPSWEKVSFSPHVLTRVTEDDSLKSPDKLSKSQGKTACQQQPRSKKVTKDECKQQTVLKPIARHKPVIVPVPEAPTAPVKRSPNRIANGHVTKSNGSHRDAIHTTA